LRPTFRDTNELGLVDFQYSVNLMLCFFFSSCFPSVLLGLTQYQIMLPGCSELFIGSLKWSILALWAVLQEIMTFSKLRHG